MVAGEDANDRKIVTHLVQEFCPSLGAKVVEIRDDVRLKSATGANLTQRIQTLVRKAKARALREGAGLAGIVVHEDLDGVTDETYDRVRRAISAELAKHSPCGTALALAAWESEAWLLLFPAAFPAVRPGWRLPVQLHRRDTGQLTDPKELLQTKLPAPRYRESDGPDLIAAARKHGLLRAGPVGLNRSYAEFVGELKQWA
ncbi:hypothetical protein [Allostreptomyces psammosilenae]|uniref:DUF4276 family protein n=1 Tax=Allostreptomyces psammosilenae TaxID=1892865 RepID=A0A852ZM59_9ACTN|nr:hypothetical protein [Allostreptomyces psammosilenae]NYI03496.1 hypothetical protein [Allostreptomyces psammosilenae]